MAQDVEAQPLFYSADWFRPDVVEPLLGTAGTDEPRQLDDTALVIDLPGEMGALIAVAAVPYGFRPIPLYNAVQEQASIVNLQPIIDVLVDAAQRVATASTSAPPAFMLDARRMSGGHLIGPGAFDNRSCCSESDFPSADTLWRAGIRRAVLIQGGNERPAVDLEPILLGWQRRGIVLWRKVTHHTRPAALLSLQARPWPARLLHALRRSLLRRRSDGSYGVLLPEHGGVG
jgi:hypothetical protein